MRDAKIRAIVKRPDEKFGHVTNISNRLENLQKIVGGPIETVQLTKDCVIICNEEGKLRGLDKNFVIQYTCSRDVIVGEIAIVGVDGEDFYDCPLDFSIWKRLLVQWGNV